MGELSNKLNTLHIPEGFVLVGAKSPMLTGMMLVAAVDKRYLPGERDTLTTPGFSGKLHNFYGFNSFFSNCSQTS